MILHITWCSQNKGVDGVSLVVANFLVQEPFVLASVHLGQLTVACKPPRR